MQTTKWLKPTTSGRIHISIAICCITSVLMGMLWSALDTFSIFPSFWHWSHFLINSSMSPLILCQKNIFEISCIVESLPQCEHNLSLYLTSLIILCCRFVEKTPVLYCYTIQYNCSWSIEKGLQAFLKLAILTWSPDIYNG